jgi:hypothetical protein
MAWARVLKEDATSIGTDRNCFLAVLLKGISAELFASVVSFSRIGVISTLGLRRCGSGKRSTDTCDKLVSFDLFRTEASIVCTQYTPVMLVE